jgi:hypothetical protein
MEELDTDFTKEGIRENVLKMKDNIAGGLVGYQPRCGRYFDYARRNLLRQENCHYLSIL